MSPSGPKLTLVTDAVGGVWQYSLALAHGMTDRGWAVRLIVIGPPPTGAQLAEAHGVRGLAVSAADLPLDWLAADDEGVAESARRLSALVAEQGCDVVHLNTPALADADWPVPVVATAHSCVHTWWRSVRRTPPPADWHWRYVRMKRGLERTSGTIVPSAAFGSALRAVYDVHKPVRVVHNGLSRCAATQAASREPFALTAGRLWDEAKNIATLDTAAGRLDWPIVAAGPTDGPNGSGIRLGNLYGTGRLESGAMQALMSRASIFVAPSLYEPFGLAVLEAAAGGTALALADIPTFRELWQGAAEFFDPRDPDDLARVVRRLAGDAALRTRLGAAVAHRASRYTLDAMTAATAAVYAECGVAWNPQASSSEAA